MSDRRSDHLHVAVAALTRRRPEMLQKLLESWDHLELPEKTRVTFLIVENDVSPQAEDLFKERATLANGCDILYRHEPELGIPFARNRAAREAIEMGADVLCFVDDDEHVGKDWLVRLVSGYRNSNALLLGGPVRIAAPKEKLSRVEQIIHANVADFHREREEYAAIHATLDHAGDVNIATNNWLGDITIFTAHDIWFDENLRFTGGSDAKFSKDVSRAGLPIGWVRDAIVYEDVPRDRCSFSYQYRRFRDQYNTVFHQKLQEKPRWRWMVFLRMPKQILIALGYFLALPFTNGRTLLPLARKLGWITGRLGALRGKRSSHYSKVTGT